MTAGLPKKSVQKLSAGLCQAIIVGLLGFFILSFLNIPSVAEPPAKKDSDADKTYQPLKRGSPEEKDFFEKQGLKEQEPKGKPDLDVVQEELTENPVKKIKEEKEKEVQKKNAISGQNAQIQGGNSDKEKIKIHGKETSKKAKDPWDFRVEYELKEKAKVKVMILDEHNNPVRRYIVHPDEHGARKGKNEAVVWDGADALGNNMPEGEYKAVIIADYEESEKSRGSKGGGKGQNSDIKEFRLKK